MAPLRMALGSFLGFSMQRVGAEVLAEVNQHTACNQDTAAYFDAFKAKFPMPKSPMDYKGASLPERCYDGADEEHFFVVGDYGGITSRDGQVNRADNTGGGKVRKLYPQDAHPQQDVAAQMLAKAATAKPRFILNGGDNFYFGGIDVDCGQPMDTIHARTKLQFDNVFEKMYAGADMDIPWFSVLGNHDYGGRKFTAAWDQQIAYTWTSNATHRWFLPAQYWHQRVNYPTKGFSVDIFMIDTCKADAKPWQTDQGHNVCGTFNSAYASCAKAGGPTNRVSCMDWFNSMWADQDKWLNEKLSKSDADWKIIVTHFPPEGIFTSWIKDLTTKYGVDLYVGSHRHAQEVHSYEARLAKKKWSYGYPYVIVGGGGGITSEAGPNVPGYGKKAYGFMDIAISKTQMVVKSINSNGEEVDTMTLEPGASKAAATASLLQEEVATEEDENDTQEQKFDWDRHNLVGKKMALEEELATIDEKLIGAM